MIAIILISSGSVGLDDDTEMPDDSAPVSVYYPSGTVSDINSGSDIIDNTGGGEDVTDSGSMNTDGGSDTLGSGDEHTVIAPPQLHELYIKGDYTPSEEALQSLYDAISEFGRDIGFTLVDVNTKMTISYNADAKYPPASIIKAAYALYVCRALESGDGSLDEIITYTEQDYCTGNGKIARAGIGVRYRLRDVLYHTINTSDNEGYYMLLRRFGRSGYNDMMRSLHCESGIMRGSARWPSVSASDFALVWAEIYKYRNESYYGQLLYEYFLGVSSRHFIRDALGCEMANKAGWNSESFNDTGIVYGKRTYIFVLLTSGSYYTADKAAYNAVITAADALMAEYAAITPASPETSRYDEIFTEPPVTSPPVTLPPETSADTIETEVITEPATETDIVTEITTAVITDTEPVTDTGTDTADTDTNTETDTETDTESDTDIDTDTNT